LRRVDREKVIGLRITERDLLNQWTTPVGSAVFDLLPGCQEGAWLGEQLLAESFPNSQRHLRPIRRPPAPPSSTPRLNPRASVTPVMVGASNHRDHGEAARQRRSPVIDSVNRSHR
jgi:hypothetical protein